MWKSLARGLATLLLVSACAADPAPGTSPAGSPCGLGPRDWCPAPADDPCGRHPDEKSCRGDASCRGLPYRGESAVACMPDGHGFWGNCPAVGCVSRSDAAGKPARAEVVRQICSGRPGGEGAEIRVWRTDRDEVTVLELREGGGAKGSVVYHDAGGRPQLTLPAARVAPGSALERSFDEMRRSILGTLRVAETIRCVPDVR